MVTLCMGNNVIMIMEMVVMATIIMKVALKNSKVATMITVILMVMEGAVDTDMITAMTTITTITTLKMEL